MSKSVNVARTIAVTLAFSAFLSVVNAQSFLAALKAVRDPAKRSEKALAFADAAFDNARGFYAKGERKSQIALEIGKLPSEADVEKERAAWRKAMEGLTTLVIP